MPAAKRLNAGTVYRIGRRVTTPRGERIEWMTPKGGWGRSEIRGRTFETKPTKEGVEGLGGHFVQPYRLHRLTSARRNRYRNS